MTITLLINFSRELLDAMRTAMPAYINMVKPMAVKVPNGIAFPGFLRSPDMFTPAMIPVTAGKNKAKIVKKECPFVQSG